MDVTPLNDHDYCFINVEHNNVGPVQHDLQKNVESNNTFFEHDYAACHNSLPTPQKQNSKANIHKNDIKCKNFNNVNDTESQNSYCAESLINNEAAWKEIENFHASLRMTIKQCTVCHEAWPLHVTSKKNVHGYMDMFVLAV